MPLVGCARHPSLEPHMRARARRCAGRAARPQGLGVGSADGRAVRMACRSCGRRAWLHQGASARRFPPGILPPTPSRSLLDPPPPPPPLQPSSLWSPAPCPPAAMSCPHSRCGAVAVMTHVPSAAVHCSAVARAKRGNRTPTACADRLTSSSFCWPAVGTECNRLFVCVPCAAGADHLRVPLPAGHRIHRGLPHRDAPAQSAAVAGGGKSRGPVRLTSSVLIRGACWQPDAGCA